MKILLVSLIKDFLRAENPLHPKGTIFLRFPSLALANIAALTPKGNDILVMDEQISPIDYNVKVNLVAISVNTSVAKRAYEVADKFRKKGIKVVLGGLHPTLVPEESMRHADSVIVGEAQGVWENLIADFTKGAMKKKYLNNEANLRNLPIPRWQIFKGMGYVNTNFVETSRGCHYNCEFCSTSVFYKHIYRTRPIKDVIRDVKHVKSFPRKFIFFVDDNIIGDKVHAKKLFKALIPLKICWISQATTDIGEDEELVKLAAESGCFGLFLGFESIMPSNIKDACKNHNHVEKYKDTVNMLHKYGIGIEAGFIFGFDNDDPAVFKNTLHFLKETKIDSLLAMYLTPIPGTKFYETLKKEKRLLTDDYSKYDFRHIVHKPKNMTPAQVYNGVSWITKEFYTKKLVAKRFAFQLKNLFKHPCVRRLLVVVGLLAISFGFRNRMKTLSADGTFPQSFRNI
jgi:radical SAM superfamily enzyme YgiQ (UPF0313 family)